MRNILNIDVNTECNCTCFENIDNGLNEIILRFKRDNPANPRIVIDSVEYPLEFINGVATYTLLGTLFSSYKLLEFKFVDDNYEGTTFKIICLDYPTNQFYKTLKLYQLDKYYYRAIWVTTATLDDTTYNPDDFEVDEDGELSIKDQPTVSKIIATDKGGTIINVRVQYSDETESSNDCKYDEDTGKLIKFGDLTIDWSFIDES